MKLSDKGIMAYSGTIRGAIAFGLACSLELHNELNKMVLISGTLALVLATTVILGALLPLWIQFMRTFDSEMDKKLEKEGAIIPMSVTNEFGFDFSHPNFTVETLISKEKDPAELRKRLSYFIATRWNEFDKNTLKPCLLYDFPNCIEEHEIVSKRILEATAEISTDKVNKKTNEEETENEKSVLKTGKIFQPSNDA